MPIYNDKSYVNDIGSGTKNEIISSEDRTKISTIIGYAGINIFKINFKNILNTFISFFVNNNTASRTYTFQDRDGNIADLIDIASRQPVNSDLTDIALLTPFNDDIIQRKNNRWSTRSTKQLKADLGLGSYITNPDAEIDISGWNIYNDAGRSDPAYITEQDITFTSVTGGNYGNGINIEYKFHGSQSYLTPLITVVSSTHIAIAWYNGPTLVNNPTATQLKAAYEAVPEAVAIATCNITGTASNRQYITGSHLLDNGGDSSPIDGIGGTPSGITFTRNTVSPLIDVASFDFNKDAVNRQGQGISTDFSINSFDKSKQLQISFAYSGSTSMILGNLSDVRVFIYDITNNALIPVTSSIIIGPVNTAKTFVGQFTSTTSIEYRLILHISTVNAMAWNLLLDSVTINNILDITTAEKVPSLVLPAQSISNSVMDHMAVMWVDGANSWVPATSVFNGDYWGMVGFAINIIGLTADIYIHGFMDGFSFGPFHGYNMYVDPTSAGQLTPLPSPFTDTYLIMGKAISETAINIQPYKGFDLIPSKGGLLSNSGTNDGTGDQVLSVGANGNVLVANSAASLGLQWVPAVVIGASTPFTYTLSTRTLTMINPLPIANGGTNKTTALNATDILNDSGISGTTIKDALNNSPSLSLPTSSFSGLTKITVSTIAPNLPNVGDIWIDTN